MRRLKEADDLAQATFVPPVLTRTTRVTPAVPGRPEAAPFSQVGTVALFVAALGLLIYVLKAKWSGENPQYIVLAPHFPINWYKIENLSKGATGT